MKHKAQSVDANGFTGNFSRTIEDQEKLRVPSLGPTRRNATKIRIEDTTLPEGSGSLMVDQRREKSNDDFAPLDDQLIRCLFFTS